MKKTTVLGMVAGMLSMFASCSSDLDVAPNTSGGDNCTVTLCMSIPKEIQSRAYTFSGCEQTNRLRYAIYDKATADKIQAKAATAAASNTENTSESTEELKPLYYKNIDNGDFEPLEDDYAFEVNLAENKSYVAIFWADNVNSPYTFDEKTMSVTIDYSKAKANQDSYDAFTACQEFKVNGSSTYRVTLRRPFAQINFGSDDLNNLTGTGLTVTKSAFKVRPYQSLNLFSGEVGNKSEQYVTFSLEKMPKDQLTLVTKGVKEDHSDDVYEGETFPVAGFEYVAMNYILAPTNKETTDFYLLVDDDEYELHCPNIPIQRNYRTNIYGSLFLRQNNFVVSIDPVYYEDEDDEDDDELISYETWDSSIATTLEKSKDGKYHIKYGAQLAKVFDNVNRGIDNYANSTIVLDSNLDMGGFVWTPIGAYSEAAGDYDFQGTFDGQDHIIKNFRTKENVAAAGLFGSTSYAEIKNLIIEDATVIHNTNGPLTTGILIGDAWKTKISNITIRGDIYVEGNHKVGGVFGELREGCEISNIKVEANKDSKVVAKTYNEGVSVGGVIGHNQLGTAINNITSNLDVIAYNSMSESGTKYPAYVGGFIGNNYTSITFTNCTITGNVTLYNVCTSTDTPNPYTMTIGGIVGSQNNYSNIVFKQCTFGGALTCYDNGTDITSTVKAANTKSDFCGWFNLGNTIFDYSSHVLINEE